MGIPITEKEHPLTVEEAGKIQARVNKKRWIISIGLSAFSLIVAITAIISAIH